MKTKKEMHDNQIPDSVIYTDLKGLITRWSRQAENVFGWKEKEPYQSNHKCNCIGYQQGNCEVDIRRRALGCKMIERAGTNSEGDGEVEEEHVFGHFYHKGI